MTNMDPQSICTLDEHSNCSWCGIQGKLTCNWDKKSLGEIRLAYRLIYDELLINHKEKNNGKEI